MRVKMRSNSRRSTLVDDTITEKILGKEPSFADGYVLTNTEWMDALNWYSYSNLGSEARKYLLEYYDCQDDEDMIEIVNEIHDDFIPCTAAWNSRIVVNGYNLPADLETIIDSRVNTAHASSMKLVDENNKGRNVISLHERFVIRLEAIIAEIEAIIDSEDWSFNLSTYLQVNNVLPQYTEKVIEYYKPLLNEYTEAYNGTEADLVEAYKFLGRAELKNRINFFKKFIDDGERHYALTKKVRKARLKKPVKPEKLIEKFQYQAEIKEYSLTSLKPIKLLGAQEVWLYNSRYNFITVLRATDKTGLSVKGTTIIGFDEKTSMAKRVGRKASIWVTKVVKAGKVELRKVMDEIKTDPIGVTGRSGETTCILRIL